MGAAGAPWKAPRTQAMGCTTPCAEEETPMLVMDAIAEVLKREGISHLFCYPTTPIIEAAAAAGIRPILCR
jgi:hypothetical protein